jgi:hypothetical protein
MLYINIGIGVVWFVFCAVLWCRKRREARLHYVRFTSKNARNLWIIGVLAHMSIAAGVYLVPMSWHYINVTICPLLILYCAGKYYVFESIDIDDMSGGSALLTLIYLLVYSVTALVVEAPNMAEQRRLSKESRRIDTELKRSAIDNISSIAVELQEIRQQLNRVEQRLETSSE